VTHFALNGLPIFWKVSPGSTAIDQEKLGVSNMNRLRTSSVLVLGLLIGLFAMTLPASASFPGKNGRIAFVLGPDIYTMNPDGSDIRQLTNLGPDSSAFWESWSPDGKLIVFEYRPPESPRQIWLMNADGSNQHVLLADSDFSDERPSFTSDGNSVIFSRCRLDIEGTCALFQMQINGGVITAITHFELGIQDFSPQYSSDNRLAFTGVGRNGIICAIQLMNTQNANSQRITPAPLAARQPDWSPDARRIAFSTHCRGLDGNPENEEIWTVNAKGDALLRLTKNGDDYFSGPHDFHPSWSPQGDAIVFERDAPDYSSSGIFIMKSDGSGDAKEVLALGSSPRKSILQRERNRTLGSRTLRRLKQIEDGGALPQWGSAEK
jgi:Tol biopolymer transport system component